MHIKKLIYLLNQEIIIIIKLHMLQDVENIISTLLLLYLPIAEQGLKVIIASSVTKIICNTLTYLALFSGTIFVFWKRYFTKNYINVSASNTNLYSSIMLYLKNKFPTEINGYEVHTNFDESVYIIKELSKSYIADKFTHLGKTHEIKISISNKQEVKSNENDKGLGDSFNSQIITVYGKCDMEIIKEYITFVNKTVDTSYVSDKNLLQIYKVVKNTKEKHSVKWKGESIKTNKNLQNTIVSKTVQEQLIDDIKQFITMEKYYAEKGLPYKRGYILHGPPGTGKTSIVKAIAKNYGIPIFIVDLAVVRGNMNLNKIMGEINTLSAFKKYHIVLFEDIDRSDLFTGRGYYDSITEDCFLNILDGIDENKGRITFLTSNNLDLIKKTKGLLRPGRIDAQIMVSYCDNFQMTEIFKLHFGEGECELNPNIIITPATLIHLILVIKNFQNVVKVLNNVVDFKKVVVEDLKLKEIIEKVNLNVNSEVVDNISNDISPFISRERINTVYDKMYIKTLKTEHEFEKMNKAQGLKAAKSSLLIQKKQIDLELKKIQLENFKNEHEVLPLKELEGLNYKQIEKQFMVNRNIDYSKMNIELS
jgi:SpoVK/Ycf46/Vps4 family AAA+-type ATPase